jgi:uncharacterized protein with ParB-like and HNH nuclease domain
LHRIFSFFTVKWYLQSNKQFVPPVTIGAFKTNEENKNLIIDGQQRLTSILLAYLGLYPDERTYKQTVERFANDDEDETDELDSVIDGKTQYGYKCKLLNFSKLHSYIKHSNIKMKYHKKLNCYAYDVPVDFKGLPVKLFSRVLANMENGTDC